MCGMAHSPKFIEESIAQAQAAASRAITILTKKEMLAGGTIALVVEGRCIGCGLCEEICPFGAIRMDEVRGIAVINDALCKGCGVCAASCRGGALDVGGTSEQQIFSQVLAL